MSDFTKGPWNVKPVGDETVYAAEIRPFTIEGQYIGNTARVQDCAHIGGISSHECEANAHLISAAPDMFEALEAIVDHFDLNSDPADALYDALILSPARAALAKSKGEIND